MHWRRKWQPTPAFLHGESQGQGSLVGCRLWARTELDSTEVTFKSRDITLPTKVRLVKAMVFPVVMNACESWTVKKGEHRRTDAFEL